MGLRMASGFENPRLESLRISLPYRVLERKFVPKEYSRPMKHVKIPFYVTGGIGDLIMALGPILQFQDEIGSVLIYTKWPEVVKFFTGNQLEARLPQRLYEEGAEYCIGLNGVASYTFQKSFKGFTNPKLEKIFLDHNAFLSEGDWQTYKEHHPKLDNLLGTAAVKAGLNRVTIQYKYLGLEFKDYAFPFMKSNGPTERYITVHDGIDSGTDVAGRATKTWHIAFWGELVRLIRKEFTNIQVIQLGGPKSRPIPGVDMNYTGEKSIVESFEILKHSMLHIDGDSGLVHAAKAMGVQSMVMFGPTDLKFFGYKDNMNLKPFQCGGCWWLTENWNSECPAGFGAPGCMDSFTPKYMFEVFKDLMWGRYGF